MTTATAAAKYPFIDTSARVNRTAVLAPAAPRRGRSAGGTCRVQARLDDCLLVPRPPVGRKAGELRHHAEVVRDLVGIGASLQRLDLDQRQLSAEMDRYVGLDQPQIRKKWPEPAV